MSRAKRSYYRKHLVPYAVAILNLGSLLMTQPSFAQGTDQSIPNMSGEYQPAPYQGQGGTANPTTQVPVAPSTPQESFAPPAGQYQPQQNSPPPTYQQPQQTYQPQQQQSPPQQNYGGYQQQQYPTQNGYGQQQGYPAGQQGYPTGQPQGYPQGQGYPPQQQGYAPQQFNAQPQYPAQQQYGNPQYPGGGGGYQQAGVQYAQAGTVIPCQLRTSISTQVAKDGDFIEASVSQPIPLGGYGQIPAGSIVSGQVASAEAGRRLSRSGELTIAFNQLRLPNGVTVPITAHLSGGAGKYKENNQGEFRGEGTKAKLGQTAIRGGLGAGLGAALGTGVGAIAGGGHGAGMGAWSGAAIGGGIGVGDMLLRKGRDVTIPSGTSLNVELDQPAAIPDANGTVQQPATQGVF